MEIKHKTIYRASRLRTSEHENIISPSFRQSPLTKKQKQRSLQKHQLTLQSCSNTIRLRQLTNIKQIGFDYSSHEQSNKFQHLITIKQSNSRWFRNKKPKLSPLESLFLQKYKSALGTQSKLLHHTKLHEMYDCFLQMKKNVRNYEVLQTSIDYLLKISEELNSTGIKFYIYYFAGKCMRAFGNCVISLAYFCNALKVNATRKDRLTNVELKIQLKIYYIVATILLEKMWRDEAKVFAYKYLRKSWVYSKQEDELVGYDLLGMVYFYQNNMPLAQYFHQRMCNGLVQSCDITKIYTYQANLPTITQFEAGILEFISNQRKMAEDMQDYFKGIANTEQKYQKKVSYNKATGRYVEEKIDKFMIPHLSLNRSLNNHHRMEKKNFLVNDEISSKEFFFLKPTLQPNLVKQISSIIENIKNCLWHLNYKIDFGLV